MKWLVLIGLGGLGSYVSAQEWRGKWDRAGSTWVEKWTATMDSIGDYEKSNQLEILGAAARAKSTLGGWKPTGDQVFIANRAVVLLLEMPGHADYFKEQIIRARAERTAADGKLEYSKKANDFRSTLNKSLETLSQLPSPQSVRVLGDFLSDHSVNPYPIQDNMMESPLSRHALGALAKMPLADKPTRLGDSLINTVDLERDLPAWQGWYEEIKSGQRTFRFKGDPTEYDLDGPAPPEKLERIARSDRRDAERAANVKRQLEPQSEMKRSAPENASPILWISSAVLLIVAAGYGLRKRRRKNA